MRQRAKRTDDYVNGLKWQHHLSTVRFRCCKNWSSFHYFKGDPTRSGVNEPREGSPYHLVYFIQFKQSFSRGLRIETSSCKLTRLPSQNQLHKRL